MNLLDPRSHPDAKPSLGAKLAAAIALSLLFIFLYGLSNYYASSLTDHQVVRFDWERHIPFIPAFVIPYMTIDLFFFFSFFLVTTRHELRTHAARLALTTIIATSIFVLFPMKLAVVRPDPSGLNGAIYAFLKSFDHPHNLCPSLHVAYTLILRVLYGRHTRGLTWWLFHVWFTAVSFSVLFVQQHHVIDLIGGAALATLVMYLIPSHPRRLALNQFGRTGRNPRAATAYALVSIAFTGLIFLKPSHLWPLAWPSLTFAIVTAAYLGLGPRIFRKHEGRLPLNTRVILAPYLIPLCLTRLLYNGRTPPSTPIIANLSIGRLASRSEAEQLIRSGVHAILDLTAEHTAPPALRRANYFNVPILDLTPPTPDQLRRSTDFIARHIAQGPVLVFCALGRSRSAAVVTHYLLHSGYSPSIDDAVTVIRDAAPLTRLTPNAIDSIQRTLGATMH